MFSCSAPRTRRAAGGLHLMHPPPLHVHGQPHPGRISEQHRAPALYFLGVVRPGATPMCCAYEPMSRSRGTRVISCGYVLTDAVTLVRSWLLWTLVFKKKQREREGSTDLVLITAGNK